MMTHRYPGRFASIGERALAPLLLSSLQVPSSLGSPITEETAIALRQVVFGQCPNIIRSELFSRGPGIVFREPDQVLSYGVTFTNSNETTPLARSVLMIIQAHIIRALLFEEDPTRVIKTRKHPLEPTKVLQREALCHSICDILWRAGNEESCVLCLPSKSQVYVAETMEFNQDGVTEKLQLVKFDKMADLLSALRRYLYIFQEEPGPCVILLIYSAILSRGLDRIAEDINGSAVRYSIATRGHLVNAKGSFSNAVFNLLTTGRATPFLHNGVQYRGDEEQATIAETGLLARSSIGLLTWMGSDEKNEALNIGSRLKTPLYPIWLVVFGDHCSLLFSEDRALLRDYRNEYRFQLHYYSSSHFQPGPIKLTVSTRFFSASEDVEPLDLSTQTVQKVVRTKWNGARVSWNTPNPVL